MDLLVIKDWKKFEYERIINAWRSTFRRQFIGGKA
jgi:hypothetical protein